MIVVKNEVTSSSSLSTVICTSLLSHLSFTPPPTSINSTLRHFHHSSLFCPLSSSSSESVRCSLRVMTLTMWVKVVLIFLYYAWWVTAITFRRLFGVLIFIMCGRSLEMNYLLMSLRVITLIDIYNGQHHRRIEFPISFLITS